MNLSERFKQYFGFDIRKGQEQILQLIEQNYHVFSILVTGYGKTYIPFFLAKDTPYKILYFAPLRALLFDLENRAKSYNIDTIYLKAKEKQEDDAILDELWKYRIILLTPEKLNRNKYLLSELIKMKYDIKYIIIDEAHTLLEQGISFRPSFQKLAVLLSNILTPTTQLCFHSATLNEFHINYIMDLFKQHNIQTKSAIVYSAPVRTNIQIKWFPATIYKVANNIFTDNNHTNNAYDSYSITSAVFPEIENIGLSNHHKKYIISLILKILFFITLGGYKYNDNKTIAYFYSVPVLNNIYSLLYHIAKNQRKFSIIYNYKDDNGESKYPLISYELNVRNESKEYIDVNNDEDNYEGEDNDEIQQNGRVPYYFDIEIKAIYNGKSYTNTTTVFAYHGQMSRQVRDIIEQNFIQDKQRSNWFAMSTSALGAGIDIPDIRHIIHTCLPVSLSEYIQQISRAGRKLAKATNYVIENTQFSQYLINQNNPSPDEIQGYLKRIIEHAKTDIEYKIIYKTYRNLLVTLCPECSNLTKSELYYIVRTFRTIINIFETYDIIERRRRLYIPCEISISNKTYIPRKQEYKLVFNILSQQLRGSQQSINITIPQIAGLIGLSVDETYKILSYFKHNRIISCKNNDLGVRDSIKVICPDFDKAVEKIDWQFLAKKKEYEQKEFYKIKEYIQRQQIDIEEAFNFMLQQFKEVNIEKFVHIDEKIVAEEMQKQYDTEKHNINIPMDINPFQVAKCRIEELKNKNIQDYNLNYIEDVMEYILRDIEKLVDKEQKWDEVSSIVRSTWGKFYDIFNDCNENKNRFLKEDVIGIFNNFLNKVQEVLKHATAQ